MCGFAGIVSFDGSPIDRDRLARMLGAVQHRGPDGHGVTAHPRCGLAHARLSIIDAPGGQQPMHDGPLHLVFNGEVYNHRELRRQLEALGHRFHSDHSDTEVLLLGYRQWGERLPRHLHGMFAFAIWDEDRRRLYLCRDRPGKKPLYLWRRDGELLFGSLVSSLVAALPPGTPPRADPGALRTFLRLGYPLAESMIDGVTEVPPAHWMTIDADGATHAERYWQPPPISRASTTIGAVDALTEVLREAVTERLEADVPLGCFLSGGIDSSVIAAFAQRGLEQRGVGPLHTFSVAMPDAAYDESLFAQVVADHIGAEHTVLRADPSHLIDDLTRLMAVIGEPTADSSLLATYWLCRATSHHVKVALAGDGGDELFGGYDRYRAMRWLRRRRRWIAALPMSALHTTDAKSRRHKLRRLIAAARAGADPAVQYAHMIHLFTELEIGELGFEPVAGGVVQPVPDWPDEPDRPHAAMRWDFTHYLPFELLRKVDRASMAVPVEVRCPLLATAVCDLAGRLPTRVLTPGNRPKGLLRAVAASVLPVGITRRPKMGFALPIGRWLRGPCRDALHDHLFDGSLDRLGVAPRTVRRYFDEHTHDRADHTHRLFALLQLALWSRWLAAPNPAAPLTRN